MNIVFRLPGDPEDGDIPATSTSAPLLPGTEVDGNTDTQTNVQIEKKLSTNLGGLDVRYLKILFQKMVEDRSLKIPVDEARQELFGDHDNLYHGEESDDAIYQHDGHYAE